MTLIDGIRSGADSSFLHLFDTRSTLTSRPYSLLCHLPPHKLYNICSFWSEMVIVVQGQEMREAILQIIIGEEKVKQEIQ
jgi:hypothetical protein